MGRSRRLLTRSRLGLWATATLSSLQWTVPRLQRALGAEGWLPGDALPAGALDCLIATNEHGVYCVPRSCVHRPAAQTVIHSRVWERATLSLLCRHPGDVVHAGTFFGDFLPALSRSRSGKVWAFEPSLENHRCAQITISLNDLDNVVLTRAGLSDESATAHLQIRERDGLTAGGASHLVKDPSNKITEEVPILRLDDVVDGPVSVIQLDVEGHERSALEGAMQTIMRYKPVIVLETMPPAEWVEDVLVPLGYRVGERVDANFVLRGS